MKNIAVFFGGTTVEHDVSVITGVLTLNSLNKSVYSPVPIYVHKDGTFYTGDELFDIENYKALNFKKLKKAAFFSGDRTVYSVKGKKIKPVCILAAAINCLHGERGEDGAISGLCGLSGIPLASPDILSSAVSMDKCATKIFLKGINVPTIQYVKIEKAADVKSAEKLGFPLIIKPARSGSSFGIRKVVKKDDLYSAYAYALKFDDKIIAERCAENFIEINCAAYFNGEKIIVSECEQPKGGGDILSFADKYKDGERVFPAKIDKELSDTIKKYTAKVYAALGFSGIIRIDYIIENKKIYLNEINSVPGSLAYYLFTKTTKEFGKILQTLIETAEKEFNRRSTLEREFKSEILDVKGAKR